MKNATLTVISWDGDLPLPGQFVMSERGRVAFLIVEVRRPKKPCGHVARFVCERRARTSLTAKDIVHGWQWKKR